MFLNHKIFEYEHDDDDDTIYVTSNLINWTCLLFLSLLVSWQLQSPKVKA